MVDARKVLLVDDEPDIVDIIQYQLEKEGFQVYTASDGRAGLDLAKKVVPDLVILDVMMPEMDGMETCSEIRGTEGLENVMVAFLTARGEDYSQIAGFDYGADDYITKPVKPRVLLSRVKALLRRKENGNGAATEAKEGTLRIDRDRYVVVSPDGEIMLPKKEFELLTLLMSKPGNVFTRDIILSSVWGDDIIVGDRTIDVHIRKLREKLGSEYIKTVKGVGYKFVPLN